MAGILSNVLLALLLLGDAYTTPAIFEKRSSCVQDNCYRQLIHSSASADKYCSSCLGGNTYTPDTTITTTTTLTNTTSAPLYLDTPLTLVQKRAAEKLEPRAPLVTPPPHVYAAQDLVERVATTTTPSWSPSSCTQAPTAVSSACGCFFKASFVTSTQTTTVTKEAALPTQCDAAQEYGTYYESFRTSDPPGYYQHLFNFTIDSLPGGCCAWCWGTPGCIAFSQDRTDASFGLPPGSRFCYVWLAFAGDQEQPELSTCPSGGIPIQLFASPEFEPDVGVGPCGYPV